VPVVLERKDCLWIEKMERTTGCSRLANKALVLDLYGRPFMFMLPNRNQKYKSIVGSLCTVFVFTVITVYAIYKFQLLVEL